MSLATTFCRAALGMEAPLVTVETHLANGLPCFNIVGLPEKAVQESRDRVRSALLNSGFDFPTKRITINLAPADLPKQGSRFDLAIAVGILIANAQLPADAVDNCEFTAELSLAGGIRPVAGMLPTALAARGDGRRLFVSHDNAPEAGLAEGLQCHGANHLLELTAHLLGETALDAAAPPGDAKPRAAPDLRDVHGQAQARRALEIAAAGRHNLLMIGPPGSGKSMLAHRLPGILPPMVDDEALQGAAVRSVAGEPFDSAGWRHRPFRNPHHSCSGVALVGGGNPPRPGEISLAHHGVLFLDELAEFDRQTLDVLRQPLETGRILIARAAHRAEFPADFQLVAAMNPCECGYAGDPERACAGCGPERVTRYQKRLSGPLRDRLDLQIEVPAQSHRILLDGADDNECSAEVRRRVLRAWARQQARQNLANARLDVARLREHCPLPVEGERLLAEAIDRLGLSARAFHRIIRVARTIADLDDRDGIEPRDLAEALGMRRADRIA